MSTTRRGFLGGLAASASALLVWDREATPLESQIVQEEVSRRGDFQMGPNSVWFCESRQLNRYEHEYTVWWVDDKPRLRITNLRGRPHLTPFVDDDGKLGLQGVG